VVARLSSERCLQVAGSLTFTTLLSLVPLVTIGLALIAAFPAFEEIDVQFKVFLLMNMVPDAAQKVITVYMPQFSENAGKLTGFGIALLAVTAVTTLATIDSTFNSIWRVTRPRRLAARLLRYWAVLTLGPLLIGASLSLTSWLVGFSSAVVPDLPGLERLVFGVMPALLTVAAFALLYSTLPSRPVRLRDALLGGIVAGVAFEAMKRGFALYVTTFPTYRLVYGTFAFVPIFLVWVYLSWLTALLGAVVSAVLPDWRSGVAATEPDGGASLAAALRLLQALTAAHASGDALTLPQLQQAAHIGADRTERLLERMVSAGWVRPVAGSSWALGRDPAAIRVADVFRRFALRRVHEPVRGRRDRVDELLDDIAQRVESGVNVSLQDLCAEPAARRGTA
ncbi:MAG TPA: YihY family inner membrane protein, partial [Burkholderiales bacterium]|nr:YihY family inner membrane protein [Burkholderiales bacterium]